jgi:hypothetical protein
MPRGKEKALVHNTWQGEGFGERPVARRKGLREQHVTRRRSSGTTCEADTWQRVDVFGEYVLQCFLQLLNNKLCEIAFGARRGEGRGDM